MTSCTVYETNSGHAPSQQQSDS